MGGIDFQRATRGHVTRQQRHPNQHRHDRDERQRISRTDSKQQTLQQLRRRKRQREPNPGADHNQDHSLAEDQFQYVGSIRTERDTNTNLVRALRHCKRDDTINSDRRQQ